MRRLVRSTPIQSADDFFNKRPDLSVRSNYVSGGTVRVLTFCGVEIKCRITAVRSDGIFDVVPAGDPMIREFQKAGCPITDGNARDPFVAFEWQILS